MAPIIAIVQSIVIFGHSFSIITPKSIEHYFYDAQIVNHLNIMNLNIPLRGPLHIIFLISVFAYNGLY